jgi:hypothetical protein
MPQLPMHKKAPGRAVCSQSYKHSSLSFSIPGILVESAGGRVAAQRRRKYRGRA